MHQNYKTIYLHPYMCIGLCVYINANMHVSSRVTGVTYQKVTSNNSKNLD